MRIAKSESNGLKHAFVADLQDPLTLVFPPLTTGSEQEQDKFDAVFSNAALHWCKRDPNAVIENAKRVLKKGGRFVGEMGGYMNCVGVRSALHTVLKRRGYSPVELDPWYFPHDSEYKKLLESHGFQVQSCTLHPRITPVPAGLRGWLDLFVSNSWLKGLKGEEADKILKEVEDMCRVDLFYGGNGLGDGEKKEEDGKEGKEDKDEGGWGLMYVRLRFVATLA
ncbi:hypothetical protein D9758_003369 [Tetrapyrgos nigripes]|uniref:Methyltransferase type 11 domain-containing protein n=1 Tax=Tetrapyrgos nigripes TaxID=182062 RepID=A0A8H5GVP0_9AGAR|nr:hypothetical protein D9758_003369 [Tetrapyrgos nigripes]